MKTIRRSKRSTAVHVAAFTVAAGFLSAKAARAQAPLFDNMTPILDDYTLPSDAGLYYTPPEATAPAPYNSPLTDSFEGEAYTLPTGTTQLTGVDLFFANSTSDSGFSAYPQYNGGAGTTYSAFRVNVYVWGNVTPTPALNVSNPSLNSSNPAFSSLLGQETFTFNGSGGSLPPSGYIYYLDNQGADGIFPGLPFTTPINLSAGQTTVGVTFNIQGSTDGVTYQNVAGLTPIIDGDIPPTIGSQQTNAFYLNTQGETNGNFIEGPYYFENSSGGAINYQGVGTRIFGVAPGSTYFWGSATNGNYSTPSAWTPTTVEASGPDGNDTAIFNLSSSGYTVNVLAPAAAGNLYVENDNVSINLLAQTSALYIDNTLGVGRAPTGTGAVTGSLTVENTTAVYLALLEAGSIVVGGNGGTGTLSLTSQVFVYSDSDTSIGAGSKVIVGIGSELGTGTLTIAGAPNAWTGQLDIGYSSMDIRNGSIGTVMNQLKTGYNNGKWTGQGIISSAAATDTTHLTAVGAIVNNDGSGNPLYGTGATLGQWDSEDTDPPVNAVLLKYTYYGDANLSGTVDASDYSLIDNGYLNHLTGWYNGDFNYDGVVNGSDYTLIDNAYNMQGSSLGISDLAKISALPVPSDITDLDNPTGPTLQTSNLTYSGATAVAPGQEFATSTEQFAPGSVVPEPTSLGLLALAVTPILGRRSRRARRRG